MVTGEVVVQQQDFSLPWRVPLSWVRRYGSRGSLQGQCGHGWESPADARLELSSDGTAIFFDGRQAGAAVFLSLPEPGAEVLELNNGARLRATEGGLAVTDREGLTFELAPPAEDGERCMVSRISDRRGNFLELRREGTALQEVCCESGARLLLHNPEGLIEEIWLDDPGLEQPRLLVSYSFDVAGNLGAVYDALDRPHQFIYNVHDLAAHTDREGLTFRYAYDESGRAVRAHGDEGLLDYRFSYDDSLRQTTITDALGRCSSVRHDERGLIVQETDALGQDTHHEYDGVGRICAVVDPAGRRTEFVHDARGNLVRLIRADRSELCWTHDERDLVLEQLDARGSSWRSEYDERGLLRRCSGPGDAQRSYEYDEAGDLVAAIDALGNETRIQRDEAGRVAAIFDPAGRRTAYQYDELGRVTACTDAVEQTTRHEYDTAGQLARVVSPAGEETRYKYDARGDVLSRHDGGGSWQLQYGGTGRVRRLHQPDGTSVLFDHNAEEQLVGLTNERGQRHELRLDAAGRVVEERDYWGNTRRHVLDAAGQLCRTTDALGRRTDLERDELGRLVRRVTSDGSEERFGWDAGGNLLWAENESATVYRQYDDGGNLIRESRGDFSVTWQYDAARRCTGRVSSHGHRLTYRHDAAGDLSAILLNGEPLLRITRDRRGLAVRQRLGRQLERTDRHDAAGRLVARQTARGEQILVERRFEYDAAGNLLQRSETNKGTELFSHDPMGRVCSWTAPEGSEQQFSRGPAGSLLAEVAQGDEGDGGEYRAMRFGEQLYLFDAAGDLAARQGPGGLATFQFDGRGRLTGVLNEAGQDIEYAHDALGRRLYKRVDGQQTSFYWDRLVLLSWGGEADEPTELVAHPLTMEPLALVTAGGQVRYLETDAAGLPHELLGPDGELLWSAQYGAHGSVRRLLACAEDNPVRFPGQFSDAETGLYQNLYRYFDPQLGAYVSQDPLGLVGGLEPYAHGPNVWAHSDPLGLCSVECASLPPVVPAPAPPLVSLPRPPAVTADEVLRQGLTSVDPRGVVTDPLAGLLLARMPGR